MQEQLGYVACCLPIAEFKYEFKEMGFASLVAFLARDPFSPHSVMCGTARCSLRYTPVMAAAASLCLPSSEAFSPQRTLSLGVLPRAKQTFNCSSQGWAFRTFPVFREATCRKPNQSQNPESGFCPFWYFQTLFRSSCPRRSRRQFVCRHLPLL